MASRSNEWQVRTQVDSPQGSVRVPADKSISHRAAIMSLFRLGEHRVKNYLRAGDTLATLAVVEALGVSVRRQGDLLTLTNDGLKAPQHALNCENAGTAIRLLAGALAGLGVSAELSGSAQLCARPMRRVTAPLREIGFVVTDTADRPPLSVEPERVTSSGGEVTVAVPSAQVHSALVLAALGASRPTTVRCHAPVRDHTVRMLRALGAGIVVEGDETRVRPGYPTSLVDMEVPGDFSSAAFVLAAAALLSEPGITVQRVGVNATRTGLLDALRAAGASVAIENEVETCGEPIADVTVRRGALRGCEIGGDLVVRMIDEFPVFMVVASQCAGTTVVRDAGELRVKETDRLAVMTAELAKMGCVVESAPAGFTLHGPQQLKGAQVDSHGDHRIAMALAVAGLVADGETTIADAGCASDSFPGFVETLGTVGITLR